MFGRTTQRRPRWLLFEEGCSIRIWTDRAPSLADWEDILETLQAYLPRANTVVLDGRGWETEAGCAIAVALDEELAPTGVRVATRALIA